MTFEEAVRKSIKAYFDGRDPENFLSAMGKVKYTRDYFDELEEEMVGDPKAKKKSKPTDNEEELLDGEA